MNSSDLSMERKVMNREIWQQLLSLESQDVVQSWFKKIHGKTLNANRTKAINASAKQSREFFTNANQSDYSVRSLLTFYGVACLSRAIILLFTKHGGEESLTQGHGLKTINWADQLLHGEPNLLNILNLKIETCSGLFSELLKTTQNLMPLHICSESVDWEVIYHQPTSGIQMSFGDLLSRLPDLKNDLEIIPIENNFSKVSNLKLTTSTGFSAIINSPKKNLVDAYLEIGYKLIPKEENYSISCENELYERVSPQYIHSYLHKSFQVIPNLYIATPLAGVEGYSQIAITYLLSYILGMLTRYFPTHWISLMRGDKGDVLWPAINRAQNLIESSFPELANELIKEVLKIGL
jgi:hypothetical protein